MGYRVLLQGFPQFEAYKPLFIVRMFQFQRSFNILLISSMISFRIMCKLTELYTSLTCMLKLF
jgi:hypothetical protein